MLFDIRNYAWNIFEISKNNNINSIELALDLFIANIEFGGARYTGSCINYNDINKLWCKLSSHDKKKQKDLFIQLIENYSTSLCSAWYNNNKSKFNSICEYNKKECETQTVNIQIEKCLLDKNKKKKRKKKLKIKKF